MEVERLPVPAVETPGSRLPELKSQTDILLQPDVLEPVRHAHVHRGGGTGVEAVDAQEDVRRCDNHPVPSSIGQVHAEDVVGSVTT